MIFNPFSSWGMPLEMISLNRKEFGDAFWSIDIKYLSNFIFDNLFIIIGKLTIFLYRILLFLGFMFFLSKTTYHFISKRTSCYNSKYDIILYSSLLYFLIRILFFAFLANLEARYLVEPIIWIECIVVLYMFNLKKTDK